MKKIVVVVTLFLTSYLQAQVTKNLGDFDSVKVFDKLTVKLVPSNENCAARIVKISIFFIFFTLIFLNH